MIDWSKSYTAHWRVFKVNLDTWQDGEQIGKVDAASIERTSDGRLLESGRMQTASPIEDGYYRIVLTAVQDGATERVELSTMLYEGTGGSHDGKRHEAVGRSVLYPASAKRLLAGAYAHEGADGAAYAARLLEGAIGAPVEVDGSFTLGGDVVHGFGATVLDAAWDVLDRGGWCMQVDGHGTVHVRPKPTGPVLELNRANARLLMPGIEYADDHASIPNRFTAVAGERSATAVNDDPASIVSTVSRGFVVDEVEDGAVPVDGETLDAYAMRRLRELSTLSDARTYSREFHPGVLPFSVVRGSIADAGLDGDMRVRSQSLECGAGVKVTEKAIKEVSLWQ